MNTYKLHREWLVSPAAVPTTPLGVGLRHLLHDGLMARAESCLVEASTAQKRQIAESK
jgi:hypothetical protein